MLIGSRLRTKTGDIQGFTLAEVMVALSIMAISLVVLLQSVVLGVKLIDKVEEKVVSIFLIENKMAEIEMASGDADLYESGKFEGDFENFRWAKKAETVTPFDEWSDVKMEKVTLFVFPRAETKENGLDVTTYVKTEKK